MTDKPSTLHEAQRLRAAGLPLTLCNEKRPIGRAWQNKDWTEPEILRAFARDTTLNVGLQLGPRSGIIDIESDSPEQERAFADLFAGCEIPPTPTYRSSRGLHRLFKFDDAFASLAKGIVNYSRSRGAPADHKLGIRLGSGNKAAQSVIPPSPGREWLPGLSLWEVTPAALPDTALQRILAAAVPPTAIELTVDTMLALNLEDHTDGSKRLYTYCCRGVEAGLSDDEIVEAIGQCHAVKPFLKVWERSEVLQRIQDARRATRPKGKGRTKDDPASVLFQLAMDSGDQLFHSPDKLGFVQTTIKGHPETLLIRSDCYYQLLRMRYHERLQLIAKQDHLKNATEQLEAVARHDRPEHAVHIRVAEHHGTIYIDLADEARTIVAITADGWKIVQSAPVQFYRSANMLALAIPERGGSIDALRPFVNVTDDDWPLFVGCLVMGFHPRGPYPLITLIGQAASAKSSVARSIATLIDAKLNPGSAQPRRLDDLMIDAKHSWLLTYDNLTKIDPWLSDAFCRLATGGALTKRTLFKDTDQTLLFATRPVVLTSINDVTTAPDLADRCARFELPPIDPAKRLQVKEFDERFAMIRGRVTGVLFDGVASALRNAAATVIADLPRMADFAVWATAAEEGLGLPAGSVMAAYRRNRADMSAMILDTALAKAVCLHCADGFVGTASELATKLNWGDDARSLGRELRTLAPALLNEGLKIVCKSSNGKRLIRIEPLASVVSAMKNIGAEPSTVLCTAV